MNALVVAVLLIAVQASSIHPALSGVAAIPPASSAPPPMEGRPPRKVGAAVGAVEVLGPVVSAASAAVIDVDSGVALFGKRPYAVRPLASITKLLTALTVVREHPDLAALVEVLAEDIPNEGHAVLRPGDVVTTGDLLTAALVYSDNAAARALARGHQKGTEGQFADRAMRTAQAFGFPAIAWADPAGLAPENRGTAIDVARLARAAFADEIIRQRTILPEAHFESRTTSRRTLRVRSTNALLHDMPPRTFRIVGGKTGYLDESGYNLVVAAERDGHEIVVAVLGSASHEDRFRDARILADWTFRNFQWK